MRNAYRVLVVKPERKRPIGRPMYRWEDIVAVTMNANEIMRKRVDCIGLARERVQHGPGSSTVINNGVL
jgi:hypothetical protein